MEDVLKVQRVGEFPEEQDVFSGHEHRSYAADEERFSFTFDKRPVSLDLFRTTLH